MNDKARARWVAALFLVSAWGLVLRGSVSPEYSFDPAITVTVSGTSTSSGPTSPLPTPSTSGADSGNPTPGATSGTGVGTGNGTGHGEDGSDLFSIAGSVSGVLEPGATAPINLTLTNPNDRPIRITSLSIAIASITAPRANSTLPCTSADFQVAQPLGAASLVVPAHSSRTLAALGLTNSQLPSLGMLNTADNQDGCKGATLALSYGGTAVWGDG